MNKAQSDQGKNTNSKLRTTRNYETTAEVKWGKRKTGQLGNLNKVSRLQYYTNINFLILKKENNKVMVEMLTFEEPE